MKIAKTFQWGGVEVTVAIPDPSRLARPEMYYRLRKAVDKLAAMLEAALNDDGPYGIDPSLDKALDVIRPQKDTKE